jgi:hypothetical protein
VGGRNSNSKAFGVSEGKNNYINLLLPSSRAVVAQLHDADVPDKDNRRDIGARGAAGVQANHSARGGRGWERDARPREAGAGRQQGGQQSGQGRKGHDKLVSGEIFAA